MSTVGPTTWRDGPSARWMALVGAACALLLAIVADVCSMGALAVEREDARRIPVARKAQRERSLLAHVPGRLQGLVGVQASPGQGHLELPRPLGKPAPFHPRSEPRLGPAPRLETLLAARLRWQLACVLPSSHGRIADRPGVANCPAQGPPRTA